MHHGQMKGVLLNPSKALDALRKIEAALRQEPDLTARMVSSRTGLSTAICEQTLYGNQDRFFGKGSPVRWKIRTSGPAAPRPKPKRDPDGRRKLKRSDVTETWQALPSAGRLPSEASFKAYPWQKDAFAAWKEAGRSGIVTAVTGAGKTRMALLAIREQLGTKGRVVIVVPTKELQQQWFEEISERFTTRSVGRLGGGYRQTLKDVHILIAIASSGREYSYDVAKGANCLLVADECHRYASPSNRRALDPRCAKRLGLTATLDRSDGLHDEVLLPYFGSVVYSLGYREALAAKVISPFRVAAVGATFTPSEQRRYAQLSEEMRDLRSRLIDRWGVTPEPFSAFLADVHHLRASGPRAAGQIAGAWEKRWAERRALLGETESKRKIVLKLKGAFEDADRSIVFCSTIASAQELGAELRKQGVEAAVHTSGTTLEERSRILDVFSDGRIKVLVTVQTLEEGVDVPAADLAVIMGSTRERRQMVQRMGRVVRKKADRRFARFVYTFVEGTVEDPANGAHESFMGEMFEVADELETFIPPVRIGELRRFLKPKRRAATAKQDVKDST